MQYKHTFLFTFVLGLVWAGLLFGYQNGPDPASNGVFGQAACNASGCHVGNPLNATGGSLALSGLPEQWSPGQTYPLTITVSRSGAVKYGFQLSAVSDSGNTQAGTLAAGNNRVSVITSAGVQYAQHNAIATTVAPFTGVFTVNWTAPASASVGAVRFNLAGNAANGNFQNTGDFVYTRVDRVSPAATAPPNELSFSVSNQGGVSRITDGSGDTSTGYARIQANSGSTTPTGVAIFGLRQNNALISEAGVPASPLITQGRIYAEINGPVNTGLAIANPNNQTATINFNFTNSAGVDFGGSATTVEANKHVAKFLDQDPFNGLVAAGAATFQGTFSFTSDVPVSVIALRGFVNEAPRGEFLMTTIPILNLAASTSTDVVYIPHFADGEGWTTQIILVNPTSNVLTGNIQFMGTGGGAATASPVSVTANGTLASSFPYSIAARSAFKLTTSSPPTPLASGSVRVTPGQGTVAPTALVVFSYKPPGAGITVSEAGVQGVRGSAHRMYVEVTGTGNAPGTIQTGFAITNVSTTQSTLNVELFRLDGAAAGSTTVNVSGSGQSAGFVHQLFPNLTLPFQGILRVSGGNVSVVSLRVLYNERSDFLITTTPPSNEGGTTTGAEFLFPHIVNGGGYTTQFILFSGVAGQASSGSLRFFKTDGSAFSLTLQ
ncbi:MAG: hypothetical protein HY646_02255 [Acidobacteria bacterium]|nr:hypothetical protein [Acidobacteriota bacterium]